MYKLLNLKRGQRKSRGKMLSAPSIVVLPLLILCLSLAQLHAQQGNLWSYTAPEEITNYWQSQFGNIIINTNTEAKGVGLIALDQKTGQVQWTRPDLKCSQIGIAMVPLSTFAVTMHDEAITVIDLQTGKNVWGMEGLPLKEVRGYVPVPKLKLLLVFGKSEQSKKSVVAVELSTGKVRWKQDTVLEEKPDVECWSTEDNFRDCPMASNLEETMGRHQPAIVDGDGIVLFVSEDGLVKLSAETGALLWKVKELQGKDVPMLGRGYAHVLVDKNILYVPYEKKIMAVDLTTGKMLWNHDDKFDSKVTWMEMSPEGLVVGGYTEGKKTEETVGLTGTITTEGQEPPDDFFVDVISAQTGASVWKDPYTDFDLPIPFVVSNGNVLIARKEDVVQLNLKTGKPSPFTALDWQDAETPSEIERLGDGILVISAQNMMLLNPQGQVTYSVSFPVPSGMSLLEQLAVGAVMTAMMELSEGGAWKDQGVTDGDGNWKEADFLDRVQGYAPLIQDALKVQFSAAARGDKYRYVFTEPPAGQAKGFSLAKVDKQTGKIEGRIAVEDRRPEYIIDLVTETAFLKSNSKTIVALHQ